MCGASDEGHPSWPGQRYHPAKPWSARRESSARISVGSPERSTWALTVSGPGGATIANQPVDLAAGSQALELLLPASLPHFNRYVVRVAAPGDARPENVAYCPRHDLIA